MSDTPLPLKLFLSCPAIIGPGIESWHILSSGIYESRDFYPAKITIPSTVLLPPAGRRRVGTTVKLALAVAQQALEGSMHQASGLATVFTSSSGDGDNCHALCEALASSDRAISPTRFTNSVHNAPSGYWGIAAKAAPASTSLCAHDASFSAGLLEAATQALCEQRPVLLISYDAPYPEPLNSARPMPDAFAVALLLTPTREADSLAQLELGMGTDTPTMMKSIELEGLRTQIPSARCLPLLHALAMKPSANCTVILDMFANCSLTVKVSAC